MAEIYDVIIVGAGPAGLAAGIYTSRGRLSTLLLNQGTVGGQLVLTHEIANYPGVETVSGYQLANTMKKQAKSFGCKIKSNLKITKYDLEEEIKSIEVNSKDTYQSKSVVLAPGGTSRTLSIPGENRFKGRGISYCATCDGDFFTDKEIIVVGGGNSALEEAVSLTKYASKVTVVHQFDHFQAFEHAVKEAKANPKIDFIMESELREFSGDEKLRNVKIEHLPTGEISEMDIDGVFVFVGYKPNTEALSGNVELNKWGEIVVDNELKTSVEGVFAAGDCIVKRYRQVTTAVADGTIAGLSTIEYINELKEKVSM